MDRYWQEVEKQRTLWREWEYGLISDDEFVEKLRLCRPVDYLHGEPEKKPDREGVISTQSGFVAGDRASTKASELKEQIGRMWQAGLPYSEITGQLSVSLHTVQVVVKSLGLPPRQVNRKTTPEEIALARKMHKAGVSFSKIRETLGGGHKRIAEMLNECD